MNEELELPCRYKVYKNTESFIYSFRTDNNIEYDIIFYDAIDYYVDTSGYENISNVYSLLIDKKTDGVAPYDIETRNTIDAVLNHFFENTSNSLIYECDTSDEKEHLRYRKFNGWYSQGNKSEELIKIDRPIKDNYNTIHYTTLIYHKENPFADDLYESHNEVLNSYEKPETT